MVTPLFTRYRPPAENDEGVPIVGGDLGSSTDVGANIGYGQNNDDSDDTDYTGGGGLYGPLPGQAPPTPPSPSAPMTGGAPSVAVAPPPSAPSAPAPGLQFPPGSQAVSGAPPPPAPPVQSPYSPTRAVMDQIAQNQRPALPKPSIWRQIASALGGAAEGALTRGQNPAEVQGVQNNLLYGPSAVRAQGQYQQRAADLSGQLAQAKEAEATESQRVERESKAIDNQAKAANAPLVAQGLQADANYKNAQAHNLQTQDRFITTKDGSIYDTTTKTFAVQPSDKHPGMLKIAPEVGSSLGIVADPDGSYYAPVAHYNELVETLKKIQSGEGTNKPDDKERFVQSFLKENGLPDSAATRVKAYAEYAKANQPPQRAPEDKPQHQLYNIPNGDGSFTLKEFIPGQTIPAGALNASGMNTVNTPTAQMRGRGEMAQTVIQQVPGIISQVDALKDKIGPQAGRWNQLWVNKGGMDDPDFAGLDQDLKMYASAIAIAHFGARGGQAYREALEKNFSEAQSPEDLKARIAHADKWVQGYADAAKGNQGGGGPHQGAAGASGRATPQRPAGVPQNAQWDATTRHWVAH